MSGYLTTHILDTANGRPAAGVTVTLFQVLGSSRRRLVAMVSNADGRTDAPILPQEKFAVGTYELVFGIGDYFRKAKMVKPVREQMFLDEVPVRFGVSDPDAHYHVPLLVSPFGYSTYRGS